ncbi:hypothetical protein [Haliscomenobacter sp.]|uniref:hypothetical protein n=1 Tax=Haliscomenobacter sp. TaxID=2717303 RepID=UPI003BAB37D0
MTKKEIIDLIANGNLGEAIKGLPGVVAEHLQNDVILLQSRLNGLERQERLGTIDHGTAGIERARITSAVLSMLSSD